MHLRVPLLAFTLAATAFATPTDDAVALLKEGKLADGRAALEKITVAEPENARACFFLAQVIVRGGDRAKVIDAALPWLEKATKLAPNDAEILAAYGRVSMEFAGLHTSLSAASKGREALEAALKLNPADLDAREVLYQYYTQAPWPIGSSSKAAVQLDEILKRDPRRGALLSINAKIRAKDYAAAFKLCEELLAKDANDWLALYHYGRAASIAGQNMEKGLAVLKKYLELSPTAPGAPRPANIWGRIGNIREKQGDIAAAREAYQTALKFEPNSKSAATALAALK